MTETSARAYARANAVWSQWLEHRHRTGKPRALRTALVCRQIAEEKLAALQADLPLSRTAYRAACAADWPMDDLMQIACFEPTIGRHLTKGKSCGRAKARAQSIRPWLRLPDCMI
jgi:hypothetical protein